MTHPFWVLKTTNLLVFLEFALEMCFWVPLYWVWLNPKWDLSVGGVTHPRVTARVRG